MVNGKRVSKGESTRILRAGAGLAGERILAPGMVRTGLGLPGSGPRCITAGDASGELNVDPSGVRPCLEDEENREEEWRGLI